MPAELWILVFELHTCICSVLRLFILDGDFKVSLVTSKQSKAFDDQVFLTVYGDAGNSGQLPLGEPGKGFFKPGTTEKFDVCI